MAAAACAAARSPFAAQPKGQLCCESQPVVVRRRCARLRPREAEERHRGRHEQEEHEVQAERVLGEEVHAEREPRERDDDRDGDEQLERAIQTVRELYRSRP